MHETTMVPPHDLDAERAVLASIFWEPNVLEEVQAIVSAEQFYHSANRRIFEAFVALASKKEPIDASTVTAWLRTQQWLADVGGTPYLATLFEGSPVVAHVGAYAEIVSGKFRLRTLITTCQRLMSQAYVHKGDVQEFLDHAEQQMFEIARRQDLDGLTHVSETLRENFKEMEEWGERGEAIVGTSTGFRDLDQLTSGLHPTDLIIVAARPGMGKSSLAVGIGVNAARQADPEQGVEGHAVAIFSLEMPKKQIVNRMAAAEAKIDVQRLRNGKLSDTDWPAMAEAASFLGSLPIFTDDSAGITVLDIRGKLRRLQSTLLQQKTKLALVVIDYLQLMRAPEKGQSREQEIAEISRGLKEMAKELEVPVMALSQLNRSVEQRADKRPMMSDLRECVVGDTLVCLADGRRVPIRELVGQTPTVLAMTPDQTVVAAPSDCVWKIGKRPVFKVTLASGRTLRATARHRLYGHQGWVRLGELAVGDRLATARRIPEPTNAHEWPELHLALLGQLVGDGSYLSHQPMRYTTASEENSAIVAEAARSFGSTVNRHAGRGNWHQLVLSGNGNRWHPAGVNKWLRDLGIYGQRSHEKRLPSAVFALGNRNIATLLRHLWATDGCITVPRNHHPGVHFSTCSRGLADDVMALLLRLGIVARLSVIPQRKGRDLFSVHVSGSTDQRLFLEMVGAFGPRCAPAEKLARYLDGRASNTNVDTLPVAARARLVASVKASGLSDQRVSALYGRRFQATANTTKAPSRAFVESIAHIAGDEELVALATSGLFWDRVTDITPDGEEEVFDLTVPGPSSWLADGIISHNSGALEQDADTIMFIYRDGYYNKDKPDTGETEVIVAKQRNGPTGKILVRFEGRTTRFYDMENDTYSTD